MTRIDPSRPAEVADPGALSPDETRPPSAPPAKSAHSVNRVVRHTGSPPQAPALVTAEADRLLGRSLRDWAVTDAEVDRVATLLSGLSPKDFATAIDGLDRSGKLQTFVDNLDRERLAAFLATAAEKGYVREAPTQGVPLAPLDPPTYPVTYRASASAPDAIRAAIHAHDVHAWRAYDVAYREYIDRYCDAVGQASSAAQLRDLGPISPPLDGTDRRVRATNALQHQRNVLRDRADGGTLGLTVGAVVQRGVVKAEQTVTLDSRGVTPRTDASLLIGARGGVLAAELDPLSHAVKRVQAGPVAVDHTGRVELHGTLRTTGFYSFTDPVKGTGGAGVTAGGFKAEVQWTGMGLDKAAATGDTTGRYDFFAYPDALYRNVPWEALPADLRASLLARDWTAEEWQRRLAAMHPEARHD